MRIVVWGLGYVGTVTAACLARLGHDVVGVEPNAAKVDAVNAGRSPIHEPGLEALLTEVVSDGRLRATSDGIAEVANADVSLICVGTPSSADGSPVMTYIDTVSEHIGQGLKDSNRYHVVVLRSTVFPGVTRERILERVEAQSGKTAGDGFGLVMNPEFLREASALYDFENPPYTVIGSLDERAAEVVAAMYDGVDAPIFRVALEEAELLKLVNNAFHALKVGFANEVGRMCERVGIDSHTVMEMVIADRKLNISPAYLRPGFAFGGSCLPKDLRSLNFHGRRLGVHTPILDAVLPSNQFQVEAARQKIHALGKKRVTVLGLSFKAGTDDLRESPVLTLIRDLWQDGFDVVVHDPDVHLEAMLGSNRDYLERQLPQIHQIFQPSLEAALAHSEIVVVSQKRDDFVQALQHLNGQATVLDLVRLSSSPDALGLGSYNGLSW